MDASYSQLVQFEGFFFIGFCPLLLNDRLSHNFCKKSLKHIHVSKILAAEPPRVDSQMQSDGCAVFGVGFVLR